MGFKDGFVHWIKLFNHGVTASVLQCGFLSDPIKIERGCRQGDPISPYLFIIAAQILSLMISQNPNIMGITIDGVEFKIIQYADDTTLFLDGSLESLTSALNILDIFGSLSGLKVNKEKTKIIWIGKKRNCKTVLLKGLHWVSSHFNLLGLTFSTDLHSMMDLNFESKLKEIRDLIKIWEKRYLTPIGKITIVKTFLMSKLNHLFQSLPTPGQYWLKQLEGMLFKFIWSNMPDKINRQVVTLDKKQGGLQMPDLKLFIKSLKGNLDKMVLQRWYQPMGRSSGHFDF